jgi:glycosyltransferase involved in cell wall biosynthesis
MKSAKRKVCHISTVHPWDDVRIFHKECFSLVEAGYDVSLVVPHTRDETANGVRVIALPKAKNRFQRMAGLSFNAFRRALEQNAEIYHFHDPELIAVGMALKLFGKRVIYDVHEDLPRQIENKEWLHPFLRKGIAYICECVEWFAGILLDGIVAVTPTIAGRFPAGKTWLVQNYPRLGELVSGKPEPVSARKPVIVYIGGITETRGARTMVEAMSLVPEKYEARLFLAGNMDSESLFAGLQAMPGWIRVEFLGWQSREQVADLLGAAKIGMVPLHPTANHIHSQPIKLFEYMSAGIPVIASDFPLWREIVDGCNCGVLVDPMDPSSISKAICTLLDNPEEASRLGENGRMGCRDIYNWNHEAEQLLNCYATIIPHVR